MTTFIHLPNKSTENYDWNSVLKKFLTSTFGRSFTEELANPIEQLNRLRISIEHTNHKDGENTIQLYMDYITQLNSLGLRLPMEIVIKDPFKWSDAFASKSTLVEQKSLSFEKASVMFNLASIYAYLGAVSSSSMDWKLAVNYFTSAAGVLKFISTQFLHAPTNDLKVDLTKGFSILMVAQSQECFLWNYMQSDGVKHSLAARLAEGTSLSYRKAADNISNSEISIDSEKEVEFKSCYFHTFALFHYAQSYADSNKVGFAIAINRMAKKQIGEGKRLYLKFKGKIEEGLHRLLLDIETEIDTKTKEWEKDNDLIYHDTIPESCNVPTIKYMDGAKAKDFESILKSFSPTDLFAKIVPMEAHQSMSIYSERQAEIVRKYNESVAIANEEVISLFEFSNLSVTLGEIQNLLRSDNALLVEEEEREKQQDYPRVLAIAHEISTSFDKNFTKEMENIENKREMISAKLKDIDEHLTRDEKNMLIKGLSLNAELFKIKDEVCSTRRILKEASLSDSKLIDLWSKFEAEIDVLYGGAESVQRWLSSFNDNSLTEKVSLLDLDDGLGSETDLLNAQDLIDMVYSAKRSLELLSKERTSTLTDLKGAMHDEDISSVLIKYNGASKDELNEVFDDLLDKYKSYTTRLDNLIYIQDEKILEFKDALSRLLDLPLVKKKMEEKKKNRGTVKNKLAKLISAYETWKVCSKGVNEALGFYTKLWERVLSIDKRVTEVVNMRGNAAHSESMGNFAPNTPQYPAAHHSSYPHHSTTPFFPTQSQPSPPSYTNVVNGNNFPAPPLPSKPTENQPYSTPSVFEPNMYSQFGQSWKKQ
ncbi:hypothetical protein CANINC_003343 [Pichia inconspicua]|uniref:BRO domain-containing protein 1 n=1 Tax=Pichia inconspicua TaxID=52247 RepID=A0A4V4NFH7_9ASCO|nr:hypothetical protein CANINC_003343 [[Candida] inconspicua]